VTSRVRDTPAAAEPPITVEHREQLIYLLREAAELEHTILCEYIFAAFTMKQRVDERLTAAQLAAVDHWRTTILLRCLLYTSPSPRDLSTSRMPSSA